jgi:hypothetical protein
MAKPLVHDEELLLNREPSGRCSRANRLLFRFWSGRAAKNCALKEVRLGTREKTNAISCRRNFILTSPNS